MIIERNNYQIEISKPTLYVDNESRGRSGHMTHAMAEFAPGKLIDFNSNCSAVKCGGHSTFGFIEYRISEDGGETFSDIYELPYSKELLYDGIYIAHGRNMARNGFVLYTSEDGQLWDEGGYIAHAEGVCYYSNNIVLKDGEGKNRLLVQYSETYRGACVNVKHVWLKARKK